MRLGKNPPSSGPHLWLKIPKGILSESISQTFSRTKSLSPRNLGHGPKLHPPPSLKKQNMVFFLGKEKKKVRILLLWPTPFDQRPEKFSASFWRAASTPTKGLVKGRTFQSSSWWENSFHHLHPRNLTNWYQNGHVLKESPFPNHQILGIHVSFRGCTIFCNLWIFCPINSFFRTPKKIASTIATRLLLGTA